MKFAWPILISLSLIGTMCGQSNPIPLIYQPLIPATVQPGHAGFTLAVRGTGFVPGAVVRMNGVELSTRYISKSKLKAHVPAKLVANPHTASITVANAGTIPSNVIYLPIQASSSNVIFNYGPQVGAAGEVTIGNFNSDNRPDISAVLGASGGTPKISILFNRADGGFREVSGPQPLQQFTWGPNDASDFNNDGNLDLGVCETSDGLSYVYGIFLGNGQGGMTLVNSHYLPGCGPSADVNSDGKLDWVIVSRSPQHNYLEIFLGNGDGTFGGGFSLPLDSIFSSAYAPVIGDFNRDGRLDVAVPGFDLNANPAIAIFLGNGDGTVQNGVVYGSINRGFTATVADINGDGKLDIITNGITVFLGNGDGTFISDDRSPAYGGGLNFKVGDLDGDGRLDLAIPASGFSNRIDFLLGQTDGTFVLASDFSLGPDSGGFFNIGMADFNHDGALDIAVSNPSAVVIALQNGH